MLPQLCCKVMTLVKKITLAQQEDQEDKQTGYFLTGKVIFDRNIESTFSSMWRMIGNIYVKQWTMAELGILTPLQCLKIKIAPAAQCKI